MELLACLVVVVVAIGFLAVVSWSELRVRKPRRIKKRRLPR